MKTLPGGWIFSLDATAHFADLLEVNQEMERQQMAEKTPSDMRMNKSVIPYIF